MEAQETKPEKYLVLADDGDCMQDVDVFKFYTSAEAGRKLLSLTIPIRRAMVETHYLVSGYREQSIIRVTPVNIRVNKKIVEVMADVVTGTLYYKTGKCLSSDRRRIIKWEK